MIMPLWRLRAAVLTPILLLVTPAMSAQAAGIVQVEAAVGETCGVGRVVVNLPREMLPQPLGAEGLKIYDAENRVLYPAVKDPFTPALDIAKGIADEVLRPGPDRPLASLLGQIIDQPPRTNIYFLFSGNTPLRLTVDAGVPMTATVRPQMSPALHQRLLKQWWEQYTDKPGLLKAKATDYPPLVSNYLETMLSRRLGLPLPNDAEPEDTTWRGRLAEELGVVMGTEEVRVEIERDRMLSRDVPAGVASEPLPAPIDPPPVEFPEVPEEVKVEPIAMRVPAECLYVRFGSFANFLWIQDTLDKWGGDAANLVALRGLDLEQSRRIEERLVLKQSAMGRLLGGTIIADVAIIGTDLFMREGAAFGLLFQARNSMLLSADFNRQRSERMSQDDSVTEEKLEIDGHKVSFLSSLDGTVCSYYVSDGEFHLITTSETLVRRFLETAGGEGALGTSVDFRHARSEMPLERNDTVFAYFSDAFFRNFTSPRYRIEMIRRLRAVADIELVQMARLASAAENQPGDTIAQLIEGGFLPPDFGPRGDGSQTMLVAGEVFDSLRGRRGAFKPIPDVPVEAATPGELADYRRFADFYANEWGRLDPMIVGIQREALSDNRERVVIDAQANPFARRHVEFLSQWIGELGDLRLAPIPGNLVAGEIAMPDQIMFGGLRDFGLPFEFVAGRLMPTGRRLVDTLVGYIGTTGEMGLLSLLDSRISSPVDPAGYASSIGGMWRRYYEQFAVFSFQRDVLAYVTPQLRFVEAERPAQIRFDVADPTKAHLSPAVRKLSYMRTRETSLGNLRLLKSLDQQLHVPGPDCREAAELILDARLVDPLGGDYVYREAEAGLGRWTSTALERLPVPSGNALGQPVPPDYEGPPMNWFRGLTLDALMEANTFSAHVEVDMKMPEAAVDNGAKAAAESTSNKSSAEGRTAAPDDEAPSKGASKAAEEPGGADNGKDTEPTNGDDETEKKSEQKKLPNFLDMLIPK